MDLTDKNGGLLTACACMACLLILFCAVAVFFFSAQTLPDSTPLYSTSSSYNSLPYPTPDISKPQESQEQNNTSSAVTAGSSGKALGKIKGQFFSPYSAGTKYNNVFINNKSGKSINLKKLLSGGAPLSVKKNKEPQVLIVHTHTTESYMLRDSDHYTDTDATHTRDETKNMVAVGAVFADRLENAGIEVLHLKTIHDYPSYSGSYDASAATVKTALKEYPSIKVILDIHRDSISDGGTGKVKPVVKIGDKTAAQVMLVMGTNHKNFEKNLSLAARYHQTMEVLYPGLARPMTLYNKKYNQELHTGSMLIEVGTDANTLEEALYGARLGANALVSLLNTLVKE